MKKFKESQIKKANFQISMVHALAVAVFNGVYKLLEVSPGLILVELPLVDLERERERESKFIGSDLYGIYDNKLRNQKPSLQFCRTALLRRQIPELCISWFGWPEPRKRSTLA